MGAVAVGSVLFDMLFWGCAFLRMGTTALIAQYHGAGRKQACGETLVQALMIGLAAGSLLVVAADSIAEVGL